MTEVLDLSKVVKRDTIRLRSPRNRAGQVFELASFSDFGVYEIARFNMLQTEEQAILKTARKGKLTQKNEQLLLECLGECVKLLVRDITPAALRQLTRQEREQIILTWAARNLTRSDASGEAPSRRTTPARSRDSRTSTAATRRRGGTSRAGR